MFVCFLHVHLCVTVELVLCWFSICSFDCEVNNAHFKYELIC